MGGSKGKTLMCKGKFYRKSLITILLIASCPGLLIGLGIYFVGTKQIIREFNRIHAVQFQQSVNNIDDQFADLELSISHWAFEPQFDETLQNLDLVYGYHQVRNIFKTLLVMKGLHPLIDKVDLYVHEREPLLFSAESYERVTDGDDGGYSRLLRHPESSYWTYASFDAEQAPSLWLIHKIPGTSPNPYGIFLVSIDLPKAENLITALTPNNQGTSFLLQEDGGWITPRSGNAGMRQLNAALRAKVVSSAKPEQPFVFAWEGEEYSVSYGSMTRLGTTWTYVSATPLSSLTVPVVMISRLIVGFSVFGLLLAVALSWVASERLYRPVGRLVKLLIDSKDSPMRAARKDEFEMIEKEWRHLTRESSNLQARLEAQLPHVRESFLLQLAHGYLNNLSEDDLRERMGNLGWNLAGGECAVTIVQLLGFSCLESRFSEGDQDLVTFAAANIIQELAENAMEQVDVINFHDLTVGLLVTFTDPQRKADWKPALLALFAEMTTGLNKLLHMQVAISFSPPTKEFKQIPFLMEQAKQRLRYRDVQEGNQILDPEALALHRHQPPEYPFQLENEVIHQLHLGMEEEAGSAVERFATELRSHAGKEWWVQQGMLHLLGSVQHAIMQSGTNLYELFEGANLYNELCQLREPEEIVRWFRERVISPFIRDLLHRQDLHTKQLVEHVLDTIHRQYMEDISLDAIAEHRRITVFALSRLFKQASGLNFIDYLTKVRIDKAKELLRDTELRLNDVAERVGYQQSYFSRIFKKHAGVTPSRYREISRYASGEADGK